MLAAEASLLPYCKTGVSGVLFVCELALTQPTHQ